MKNLKKLKLFAEFVQNYTVDFERGCHFIISAIGSPVKSTIPSAFTNQLQLPIYIFIQEPQENILLETQHRLIRYDAPFEHIMHITVGDVILESGVVSPLLIPYKQSDKTGIINRQFFTISKQALHSPIKTTLESLIINHQLFNEPGLLQSNAKNEIFYIFETEDEKIVISAIEIMRFFYLLSPGPSLIRNILDPNGINQLFTSCQYLNDQNNPHFILNIHSSSQMDDHNKIFYFVHSKKSRTLFSSIYHNFLHSKKIDCKIPSSFTLNFMARCFKKDRYTIITRIDESDIASHMKNWYVEYFHPHSKPYTIRPKKDRKPSYNRQISPQNTDDISKKQQANKKKRAQKVTDTKQFFGEEYPEKPAFILGPHFDHKLLGEPVERDAPDIPIKSDSTSDLSLGGRLTNEDGPTATKIIGKEELENSQNLDEAEKLLNEKNAYINSLILAFQAARCEVSSHFKFVEKVFRTKKFDRRALKFYLELSVKRTTYANLDFKFIEILGKKTRYQNIVEVEKKEILLVKCDNTFKEHYITDFVNDQLLHGNHQWGTESTFKELFTHDTIKHGKNIKNLVARVLAKVKKL